MDFMELKIQHIKVLIFLKNKLSKVIYDMNLTNRQNKLLNDLFFYNIMFENFKIRKIKKDTKIIIFHKIMKQHLMLSFPNDFERLINEYSFINDLPIQDVYKILDIVFLIYKIMENEREMLQNKKVNILVVKLYDEAKEWMTTTFEKKK